MLLYEAEAKGVAGRRGRWPPVAAARRRWPPCWSRASSEHRASSTRLIAAHATGWTLERMPAIDRTVLRIAVFELMDRPDVPTAVVIDEAVELAKRFSTDDSGRFVNGMLSAMVPVLRPSA